ncbi:MAG: host-nuclease inhibitor Gam family protein, partial [Candidatus Saccharibacteria bacterium]
PMVQALFHYVVGARETLFVSRTVANFVHGTIKLTIGKPLLVTNDAELVKTLEQLGRGDLVIVTKAPDKKAIAKETALLDHLPQARIGKSATYTLSIDPSPLGGNKSLTEKHTVTD